MARISILGVADPVAGSAAVSLLNSLLAAGVGIRHDCGGKALCGTCAVRIARGADSLSPIGPLEAACTSAAACAGTATTW